MGDMTEPEPVLLVLAAFSRHSAALDWARVGAESVWGPAVLASPRFSFVETDYYEPTMGPGHSKCFWAFERLIDPATLVEIKSSDKRLGSRVCCKSRARRAAPAESGSGLSDAGQVGAGFDQRSCPSHVLVRVASTPR